METQLAKCWAPWSAHSVIGFPAQGDRTAGVTLNYLFCVADGVGAQVT